MQIDPDLRALCDDRPMPVTRLVGNTTVIALEDGLGPHFAARREMLPDASDDQWRAADALDPKAVTSDGQWLLRFRCFAIRLADGSVIMVDAGIGPAGAPASSWAPVPGRLPDELAAADIDPVQVSTVVLTHMHTDHIGWAVVGDPEHAYFPNASYVLQRNEKLAIEQTSPELVRRLLAPLRSSDQLRLVDGDVRLDEAVSIVSTPGHTPGHQSVLVHAKDANVLVTGDLLVHAVQLVDPGLAYGYEADPAMARQSRVAQLQHLREQPGALLATSHLGEPFGYAEVLSDPSGIAR